MIKITAAKKQELTERLKWLVDEGRRDAVEKIKEARSFGDLSENSEYDIAREHQRKVEEEISELTNVLDEKNHVVIAFKDSYDHVEVGCQVVIQDMKTQEKKTFKLLGKYEADPYAQDNKRRIAPRKSACRQKSGRACQLRNQEFQNQVQNSVNYKRTVKISSPEETCRGFFVLL